jgi:uncharacterized membrane protein YqiK
MLWPLLACSASSRVESRLTGGLHADRPCSSSPAAEVAGSQRWERREAEPQVEPVVHIAEKFRLAFQSQQQRLQAKAARLWQQQRRRELRCVCSPTEAAIAAWEAACEL